MRRYTMQPRVVIAACGWLVLAASAAALAACLTLGMDGSVSAQGGRGTAALVPRPVGSMMDMDMPPGMSMAMPPLVHPHERSVSVASLTGPLHAAHVRTFTLTAREARLSLGAGAASRPSARWAARGEATREGVPGDRTQAGAGVDAWTYNGMAPGPTLRVRQGDLVVVHLINRLPVPTTIHWHGVVLPNGEDGVAGLTQDAVAPGHTYTYRFVATQPGTYWYHAHQDGVTQVARGLYGVLIVAPATAAGRDEVDAGVALHVWQIGGRDVLAANGTAGTLRIPARPGAWVRLRLVNTDSTTHLAEVVGAPFTVVALDGHDLHGPSRLTGVPLPIGAGQRYDVRFRLPLHGAAGVRLASLNDNQPYGERASIVVGRGAMPATRPVWTRRWFDLATYGRPLAGGITLRTRADASYTLRIGMEAGAGGGLGMLRRGVHYTINGKAGEAIAPIIVKRGQLVRLHIVNDSSAIHPMHLHGHTLVVLARDGHPLTGSTVMVDTVNLLPHESYDVAFRADNPGIWMLHCHNLYHARLGMTMMVMYDHVTTPFHPGGRAGNIPD